MFMTLTEWLGGLPGLANVTPIRVTINGETWEGAEYDQTLAAPEGARNPGAYNRHAIYLLGRLPKSYRERSQRECYHFVGQTDDWYVACYHGGPPHPGGPHEQHPGYTPFGPFFILMKWDSTYCRIDEYEKPYRRHEMTTACN